jgi:GntR family transcriptional regulator
MDGDPAIPPYAWIAWQLRDAIRAGAPGLGEPMPSESELAGRYGVSRMTAGKALGLLAAEGLIRRRRGSGSVVTR